MSTATRIDSSGRTWPPSNDGAPISRPTLRRSGYPGESPPAHASRTSSVQDFLGNPFQAGIKLYPGYKYEPDRFFVAKKSINLLSRPIHRYQSIRYQSDSVDTFSLVKTKLTTSRNPIPFVEKRIPLSKKPTRLNQSRSF